MYWKYSFIFLATAQALSTENGFNQNEALFNKLQVYKNLTGITNDEMITIWKKYEGLQKDGADNFPKFRVAMSKSIPAGTINPVQFDVIKFNQQIEYHNGVVIIMQPGYYTFTVQARPWTEGGSIKLFISVENRHMTFGQR